VVTELVSIGCGFEMAKEEKRLFNLTLAGQLSLDLVNTVDWRTSDHPQELLNSYGDLVRWGRHTGLLSETEGRRLMREAGRRPAEADQVLESALALRETLYRIFSAVAKGRRAEAPDLDYLNGKLSKALSRRRVTPAQEGYVWDWTRGESDLGWLLWEVARASGDLLTSHDLKRLRECAGEGCAWMFLDTSRNQSRRWCSMRVCGNRAKARRHYEQKRAG